MGSWFFKKKKKKEHQSFIIEEEEKNKDLGLKIHICGDNPLKQKIIDEFFNSTKITDKKYNSRAQREFKTDQFYWIANVYDNISKEVINKIKENIAKDRDELNPQITQQVILCFISPNNENLLSLFNDIIDDIYVPLFIIVSENAIQKFENVDCRRITNIISKDMKIETLNSRIISALWEDDCYYNEKGNKICRYTPDNIFKSLEVNLSFYSINILLTGKSRAGKSTFINYLSNKLIALESSEKISVTHYLTEYYLYLDSDNKQKVEHTSIKLIDSPGIVQNDVKKSKELLEKILNNKENDMERQIHFILFFFMEGDSLEGINEIFDLLNKCDIPVLFVINKAFDDSDKGKTKEINSTISLLKRKNYLNLINKDNYIGVNLVKNGRISSFGVEDIFKRIYQIYKEKNKFSKGTKTKISEYIKEYHNEIMKDEENINEELSQNIDKLKEDLSEKIIMFKYLNIFSIINNGQKPAAKCKNVIKSLNNLSDKLKNIEYDIPAISFFQAFMVKEIGEIFGFDTKEMNYGIRSYLSQITKQFNKLNFNFKESEKKEMDKKINLNINIIENQIKTELEKPNQEFILNLADLFKKIKEDYDKKGLSDEMVNINLTNEIFDCCVSYLEFQLKKSKGLIFFTHYFNICEKLLIDLEQYSQMNSEEWGKKEIKVIKE